MNADELAKMVAMDLGVEVQSSIDAPPTDDRSRAFGISEGAALAGIVMQCAQFTYQIWQARQDSALLVAAIANNRQLMEAYPRLDPEKRLGVIAKVLAKFLPESFGRSEARHSRPVAEKQLWINEYLASRRGVVDANIGEPTRGAFGNATILLPFADQYWWIVYKDIVWVPDASDGTDVVRVDVPRGFVTDLTSVPRYLWAVLQKTGKYGNAAIYHDWLYWQQSCPRAVADRVFERAMNDMGVDTTTRHIIWAGVRVFGGQYWDENAARKNSGENRVLTRFPEGPTTTWEDWRQLPDVFA